MVTRNLPVHLQRRPLPEQLRYLAAKLANGTASPGVVALALQVIADEQDHAPERTTDAT